MSHFVDVEARATKELAPGVRTRTFWGDKMLLSRVELDASSEVPSHTHPHEQSGVLLSGEMEMEIGGEVRHLLPGDAYIIPGNVPHSARTGAKPAVALDVFSPVRDEFKY